MIRCVIKPLSRNTLYIRGDSSMKKESIFTAAALVRGLTDELAAIARPPAPNETVQQLIQRVREISAQARAQMRQALASVFPHVDWIDSEAKRDSVVSDSPHWVYDPIDGAYHYLQGLPLWSSSLALVSGGRAVLAFVYDPLSRELFVAEDGNGTTLNGRPVRIGGKTDLRAAVVGSALPPFGYGDPGEHELAAKLLIETSKNVFVVRQMAAASLQLAYVAAGRLDAYLETGSDVYDWIGGALLVQEAGGKVTSLSGSSFDVNSRGIVATSSTLSDELLGCATRVAKGQL
jgi:myo-inositol-1(or 4)-monophosphatase